MTATLIGLAETLKRFEELGQKVDAESADKACKAAAQSVRAAVIEAAPRGAEPPNRRYGPIHRNVFTKKVEQGLSAMASSVTYKVGISQKAFYAYFIEHGYDIGGATERSRAGGKSVTKHTGTGVKHIAARPFFRPTVDRMEDAVLQQIEQTIQADLDQFK